MKKLVITISVFAIFSGYYYCSCKEKIEPGTKIISQGIIKQVDSFETLDNNFLLALKNNTAAPDNFQQFFLKLRLAYKKTEWAIEYFTPVNARSFNGAPVEEVEANGMVYEPAGLQVMEPLLFPQYDTTKKATLVLQLHELKAQCEKVKRYFENIDLFDWQIFDAAKLEIFRVETLGITGFDNPLTLKSMQESAACLQSVKTIMTNYAAEDDKVPLSKKIDAAIGYLLNNPDFNSFDRAAFIIHYANPVTICITQSEKRLKIHEIIYKRLLNEDAQTLFDTDAFNQNAYTLDISDTLSPEKVILGKMLFADPVLSGNGKRSCQSCHQPGKAFTDGLVTNKEISSNKTLPRNTPTLINAALQPAQFYDLRANTLEQQAIDVINNKHEMNGSLKLAAKKLSQDVNYKKLFSEAFPGHGNNEIDSSEILLAISYYVRTLVALNSRFDAYMRGNDSAMNKDEINGFNLFMGKAKCATCHYMPLFNGTFPPRYMRTDPEVIGVPQFNNRKESDTDEGAYNIIRVASLKHAFKTPTLRNVALTAPYMHNGVFSSLEEVIDFYNNGGGRGEGFHTDNQTLPFDKLNLSEKEKKDLIAFIKCLNSEPAAGKEFIR